MYYSNNSRWPKGYISNDNIDVHVKMKNNNECKYLLTIIDTFSKYAYAYVLKNKKTESALVDLKHFKNNHGKWTKLPINNCKESINKLIK